MKKHKKSRVVLGLETSCDETAAAVIEWRDEKIRVLSSVVSSQTKLHAKWGGVVPNLAAREHLKNIVPVLELGLREARVKPRVIDLIAVTQGPGLIPALLIGVNAAKTLSYVWKKPLLGIHHIEGHIYANFIGDKISVNPKSEILNPKQISARGGASSRQTSKLKIPNSSIKFPVLCLVVSGGHTQLILMKKHLDYKIVGETLDDAAGEAFDKVARILGLGYPGGPAIAAEAAKFNIHNSKFETNSKSKIQNSKHTINLPRPMINKNNLNFSFSGLKTAVLYEVKKDPNYKLHTANYCHEFQQAVIDVLIAKTLKAAKIYKPKTVMLAGGVSANTELRQQLGIAIKKELKNIFSVNYSQNGSASGGFNGARYIIPDIKYSIDNAAMIAAAAVIRFQNMTNAQKKKAFHNWKTLQPDANLKLS